MQLDGANKPTPDTEAIDRLFLELSQFTNARTAKEIKLERDVATWRATVNAQTLDLKEERAQRIKAEERAGRADVTERMLADTREQLLAEQRRREQSEAIHNTWPLREKLTADSKIKKLQEELKEEREARIQADEKAEDERQRAWTEAVRADDTNRRLLAVKEQLLTEQRRRQEAEDRLHQPQPSALCAVAKTSRLEEELRLAREEITQRGKNLNDLLAEKMRLDQALVVMTHDRDGVKAANEKHRFTINALQADKAEILGMLDACQRLRDEDKAKNKSLEDWIANHHEAIDALRKRRK
jgi:hypothetical protein